MRAHKTASTKSPAALLFDDDLHDITEKYLAIRVGRGRESDILLVNHGGKPPSRLSRQLQLYAKSYDISLLTPTMHRKVIGTKASSLAQEKQEKVAALMCHSLPTQQRYYRMLEGKEDSKQARTHVKLPFNPYSRKFDAVQPYRTSSNHCTTEGARIIIYGRISIRIAVESVDVVQWLCMHNWSTRYSWTFSNHNQNHNMKIEANRYGAAVLNVIYRSRGFGLTSVYKEKISEGAFEVS